jgi:predicted RNA-binding Zn ribbon-like protein
VNSYPGPLRGEPLALELHNTLYAGRGELVDGLETADGLSEWLSAIGDRLPAPARDADASRQPEFLALRGAVRDALHSALEGTPGPPAALEVLNGFAARAPHSPVAVVGADGQPRAETRYHGADATDVALATLAADAIELLAGPDREHLRACGAPGCVLMFLKEHPRRTWCSDVCGNRARQARHYERSRARTHRPADPPHA